MPFETFILPIVEEVLDRPLTNEDLTNSKIDARVTAIYEDIENRSGVIVGQHSLLIRKKYPQQDLPLGYYAPILVAKFPYPNETPDINPQ